MRIYFLSERQAALKLDGAYLGTIDGFERFVDVEADSKILAEVIPEGDARPVSFFIDEGFFKEPPDFADVYLSDGDAVIYIRRYQPRAEKLKVIAQREFCGGLVTLFLNGGGVYLNCEKEVCNLYELSRAFENATFKEELIANRPVLLIEGEGCVAVISENCRRVFYNPAESWQCGNDLTVTVNFNTCAGCRATCTFAYDGTDMTLINSVTEERVPPAPGIMHFAFFECVMTHGNFAKYLSDELKANAQALPSYLGEFVDVAVPYSRFFEKHGDIKAAGLVYPLSKNLFQIKYFAVDIKDGKIENVYEVE
ncbi:MAG: hypothetical protein K2O44_03810 [Clostridia bacterium]|nr:hypothetical protein [Clostridia bacterium]